MLLLFSYSFPPFLLNLPPPFSPLILFPPYPSLPFCFNLLTSLVPFFFPFILSHFFSPKLTPFPPFYPPSSTYLPLPFTLLTPYLPLLLFLLVILLPSLLTSLLPCFTVMIITFYLYLTALLEGGSYTRLPKIT